MPIDALSVLCVQLTRDLLAIAKFLFYLFIALAVWLSGNALASINVVALRQTRLVLGWVTVCGRVNHFGITSQLGQLSLSSLWGR